MTSTPTAADPVGDGRSGRPVLFVGALIFDLMLRVDPLPAAPGKVLATGASVHAAGMAASAASAAARLGHPVALWAAVGDDMVADLLVAEMEQEGVSTVHVHRGAGGRSAVSAVLVDAEGERLVVPFYDPRLTGHLPPPPPFGNFAAVMADVRWPPAAAAALDGARAAGIPAVLDLDVGPRDVLAMLAPRATHVVASRAGAAILSGSDDPAASAEWLARTLAADVAVTAGAEGVWWLPGAGAAPVHLPAHPVRAVDTNAAGDVFHGVYVAMLASGHPVDACLRFANAAAAIKCTRPGGRAGAPTRAEIDAFLR
jgi:sulfofructose kinase